VIWEGTDGGTDLQHTVRLHEDRHVTVRFRPKRIIFVPQHYDTIEEAVEASASGDIVAVEPNTYYIDYSRYPEGIDFKGKAITLQSHYPDDPCAIDATVIDCQSQGRAFIFQNGEDGNSVVSGFKIINGYVEGPRGANEAEWQQERNSEGYSYGGAIYIGEETSPVIANCKIVGCRAIGPVAGNGADAPELGPESYEPDDPCLFAAPVQVSTMPGHDGPSGGHASGWGCGGALYCGQRSTPTIRNCTFEQNSAEGGIGGDGGAGGAGMRTGQAVLYIVLFGLPPRYPTVTSPVILSPAASPVTAHKAAWDGTDTSE
jgi:hypothetical protein